MRDYAHSEYLEDIIITTYIIIMKKPSRVSRRRKSIGGSRRYKKGKTANKKRVKRASSSTRRWISGGGDASVLTPSAVTTSALPAVAPSTSPTAPTTDDALLMQIKDLMTSKLSTYTFKSDKLLLSLPGIKSVIEVLKNKNIDVAKLNAIYQKIESKDNLSADDLLDLITFLYTNRKILNSDQIKLKALLDGVFSLVIDTLPITAVTVKAALVLIKPLVLRVIPDQPAVA